MARRFDEIADELDALVRSGALQPGDALPSARRLRDEHGVALATATRVLAELRARGLTRTVPGIGTLVVDDVPPPGAWASARVPRAAGRPAPRRGRPSAATRDRLVGVAVRIADTEGMGALSMRRLAGELGVPTMAVYRFLTGKDELVRLMTDHVFAGSPLPRRRPASWRAALELAARAQWVLHREHPWLAGAMSFTRPVLAPHGMAWTEWLMAVFAAQGQPPGGQLVLAMTVSGFVHGMGAKLEAEIEDEAHTGVSNAEWMRRREPQFAAVAGPAGERFPLLTRAARTTPDEQFDLDALFDTGLGLLLDGIAARLAVTR